MVPRVVVLGNPRAGRGKGAAALDAAAHLLGERGASVKIMRTERPGHAVELAERAPEERPDLVLVVGGDGTVRDVTEGLLRSGYAGPVGLLPGGTGNDLARTLGVPRPLEKALAVALAGVEREIDVWSWNDTCFINVAGVGLDAAVAREVNTRFPSMRGALPYLLALMTVLPRLQPQRLRLTHAEGEWEGSVWLAAFGNGRCYGGGMQIAPSAEPDDGLLDVVLVGHVSRMELLRELPGIFKGRHVRHPRVVSLRVTACGVEAVEQDATIDGELIGRTPARIVLAPGKLRVRVPR